MECGLPLSAWAKMVDAARPPSRPGGVRSQSLNLGTAVVRVPNLSADARLNDKTTFSDMPPSDALASDTVTLRAPYGDNLSSIGLPGEEAATFVPLIIETYDPPAVATPSHSPGPTSGPQAQLSPCTAAAAATSALPFTSPRPPAGAAVPRVASGRRTLWRQLSQSTAPDSGSHSPRASSVTSVPLKPLSVTAVAATLTSAAPTSSVPSSVSAPVASTAAATAELFSAAVALPFPLCDLPVVVFDGSVTLASDGKGTAAYLDPSKPAVRRLLPPLLHTTQPLCEEAVLDAMSPGGLDSSAPGGAGAAADSSRGNSSSNSVSASTATNRSATFGTLGGSGTPSPSGMCTISCTTGSPGLHGCGDMDDCVVSAATDLLPHTPPRNSRDSRDSPPSARRRSRPPPDVLRSSVASVDSANEGWADVEVVAAAAAAVPAALVAPCSSSSRANSTILTKGLALGGAVGAIGGGGPTQGREIEEPFGPFRQLSSPNGADGDGEDGDMGNDPSQALSRALAGLPVASDNQTVARGEGVAPPLSGSGQHPSRLDLSRLPSRNLLVASAGREVLSPSGSLGGSCASPRGAPAGTTRPSAAALPPILSRSSSRRLTSSQSVGE